MTEDASNQKDGAYFLQLVLTFQSAAWQQMGKLKNPLTDKVERDLNQARFSIDMLEMIRSKTRGNLTENEQQFLNRSISELQLNYIAEVDKEKKEKEQAPEEAEKSREEAATETKAEAQKEKAEAKSEETESKSPKKPAKGKAKKSSRRRAGKK